MQKQISFANPTEQQIQELLTVMQTKRSGKHTSGGRSFGHINGYHQYISDFMYLYHGVSYKFLNYYLALFYWVENNTHKSYLEQASRL